jgi:uncharacterized caspase-like protein
MYRALGFLAVLVTAFVTISQASAATNDTRVALVIGNSAYKHAVALPNPKNDAALMAKTLRASGFKVIEGSDLDKAGMSVLLDQFTEAAYESDVALIYYAGHGLQVDGHNYLIPVDAQLEKAAQLQTRTIAVDKVLATLPPEPAVGLVILDACRDNPLARTLASALPASRSSTLGAGLAVVQTNSQSSGSGGLLIAYATDPGAVAYDGKEVHSPYTSALARHLTTPGLEIQSALTRVRAEVSDATKGAQRPWHNASLAREVFLGGEATANPPQLTVGEAPPKPPQLVVGTAPAAAEVEWTVEQKLWDEASKRNTIEHYELYLQQFPNGNFSKLASLNIDQLREKGEVQIAAAPVGEAAAAASQVRTAVTVPDEVKQIPGTAETEAQLKLDKSGRIDLQLRLSALGHATGGADGSLGPKTRSAIGAWQRQSGIIETTYLTPQQHLFLAVQTDPLMAQARAQYEKSKAATARQPQKTKKTAAQATQRKKPQQTARQTTRQAPRQTTKQASRQTTKQTGRQAVRRQQGGGFLDSPEGAAFVGGLVGGAIGGIIGGR